MYDFILDDMPLPIAPAKLETKLGNKNKTIELVSIGEANILKSRGLMSYSFEILLPGVAYPFVSVKDGFKGPFFYLEKLQKLKESARPFSFEVIRIQPDGRQILGLSQRVSLEDYTVKENAGEDGDLWISVNLKEYRMPQIQTIKPEGVDPETGKTTVTETTEREHKGSATSYTVVAGDSLWAISKRELNDGSRYMEIAELNGIKDPNLIYPGQTLALPS